MAGDGKSTAPDEARDEAEAREAELEAELAAESPPHEGGVAETGRLRVVTDPEQTAANDAELPNSGERGADAPAVPEPSNSIVPPPKAGTAAGVVQGSRRWLFVAKHYVWTCIRSPRWWLLAVITLIQIAAVAWPILKLGFWNFLSSFVTLLFTQLLKTWRQNQPKDRHIVERNYDERKLALYKLVHAIQGKDAMTPPEVLGYQREVLELIQNYVRNHRRDFSTPTIFANLLVEEGDDLVVVQRDHDHREGRARYPKAGMLATKALSQGEAVLTGDVYRDYPDTPKGKPYFSILAIPVHRDGEVVGVVSIDSTQKFHFDLEGRKLVDHLLPYVAFLAWTLQKRKKALYLPSGRG